MDFSWEILQFLSFLAANLANQNGRLPACLTLVLDRPVLHIHVFIHKYSPQVLFVVWQDLAGAIFTLLGDRFLELNGDHRCHCTISPSYQRIKKKRKKVGGQQKAQNELFLDFIQIEMQKMWHIYVSSENAGDGLTPHFSIFKFIINSGSLRHGNASALTLRSSVPLLDNILACVSSSPDSNTAFLSAASLEMHISSLVLPVHDWTGSIDRTRLLIDSWAEWKRSKILFGDNAETSCALTIPAVAVKTIPGKSTD